MTNYAVEIRNVTKFFKVYEDKPFTFKEFFLRLRSKNYKESLVLKDVNVAIPKGECVALIGVNGCGKSTLLKMIASIIYPNVGSVEVNGKIASLLELGAGFHPDFSGRENIYINSAILGVKRKDVDKIIDQIIDFSELEEFIDRPVRTYSSGMYMRLAFAVAIHVNAEILLIDEILAVGDARFQKKCFEKLRQLKDEGVTIIVVSHSLDQIREICDRGVFIKDHMVAYDGNIDECIKEYQGYLG